MGFSNKLEDYIRHNRATIVFDYSKLFESYRKELKLPKIVTRIKRKFEYRLPYIDEILYKGPDKRKIVYKIEKQLEEAGYRKLKF